MYVTLPAAQQEQPGAIESLIAHLDLLRQPFLDIHPGVRIQFIPFAEEGLVEQVRRRNSEGLGPDLILVNDRIARELERKGLTQPTPGPREQLSQIAPEALQRLRLADGQLAGLPLLVQTEQACFNRRLLPESPADLQTLLKASAAGVPVGLSLEPRSLAWMLGAFGADAAIASAIQGGPPSPEGREALKQMLLWLIDANLQEQVELFSTETPMVRKFGAGELAWIPCRSSDLARLQGLLGNDLGVAGLPRGPRGEASPVNTLRVWAFGRNSSDGQRRTAELWTRFTITPPLQRRLILETSGNLPVNRNLPLPVESSAVLRTLEETRRRAASGLLAESVSRLDGPRLAQMRRSINDAVFQTVPTAVAAGELLDELSGAASGRRGAEEQR